MIELLLGDCRAVLKTLPDASVDSVVTDPPYELGFMGKAWDASGVAYDVAVWRECLRVLKPGGHLLAFGGSRTYHRLACAVEDAGFEIRDQIMWVYGSGFPKSLDVSKAIDKAAGEVREVIGKLAAPASTNRVATMGRPEHSGSGWQEAPDITAPATDAARRWQGWGTALKPAHEPIVVARKPLIGTVAENVLAFGCGAINVDGCRVGTEVRHAAYTSFAPCHGNALGKPGTAEARRGTQGDPKEYIGRWPANLIHDGSAEVVERFPDANARDGVTKGDGMGFQGGAATMRAFDARRDTGSAARFFYTAKADATDRDEGLEGFSLMPGSLCTGAHSPNQPARLGADPHAETAPKRNHQPTVKPTDLMRYLCRLVTPPNGVVLDPFAGSGSTGKAAVLERFGFIGIELDPDYLEIARARIAWLGVAPSVNGAPEPPPRAEPPAGAQLALSFA